MPIEEVESIWSAIDEHDDWSIMDRKVARIRRMGEALGSNGQQFGSVTASA